jgi:hypothetical protein
MTGELENGVAIRKPIDPDQPIAWREVDKLKELTELSCEGRDAAAWRVFRAMCTNRLVAFDPARHVAGRAVRDVWLGPDARTRHEAGGLLKSHAANLHCTTLDRPRDA